MWPRIKKILWFLFISANVVAVILYLLACLVPFINPGKSWFIAMQGLVFPLLFFVLLGFMIYWLIRRSKWVFICIIPLVLSWQQLSVLYSFHAAKEIIVAKEAETLRVLSWNLSSWGVSNKINKNKTSFRNEMTEFIKQTNADVLCFQEFAFPRILNYKDSIIPGLKKLGYQYFHFVKAKDEIFPNKPEPIKGVIILSKYPFVDTARFEYGINDFAEPLIYADIKINSQTVRIFTTHLESVRFEYNDYYALRRLKNPSKKNIQQSRVTFSKLKYAYTRRAAQADLMHDKIKESPYPVIVAGDFNDIPNSYTYFTIKGNLQDAFLKKGAGFGRTFRYITPAMRIDYILADKKFDITWFSKMDLPYSDHYPIIADISLPKN